MPKYNVKMIVEIDRYGVEADSEEAAIAQEMSDMIHELKNYKVEAEFKAEQQ